MRKSIVNLLQNLPRMFIFLPLVMSMVGFGVSRVGNRIHLEQQEEVAFLTVPNAFEFQKEVILSKRISEDGLDTGALVKRLLFRGFTFKPSLLQVSEIFDDFPVVRSSGRGETKKFFEDFGFYEIPTLLNCTLQMEKKSQNTYQTIFAYGSGLGFVFVSSAEEKLEYELQNTSQNFVPVHQDRICTWSQE
jgi:hypothetical protein